MIKLRTAGYCNLKLLLILLVVYCHWIEPWIWESETMLAQYRLVYLVHMPLFSFLSGLFLRREGDCLRSIHRTLPTFLICQTAAVILSGGQASMLTPWWHLWYLLSTVFWTVLAWIWFRFGKGKGKGLILLISIGAGCLAGYLPWLDRVLSGSRTVVFFPYFWLGVIMKPEFRWERLRLPALGLIGVTGTAAAWLLDQIGVSFLYHAAPFGSVENGAVLRLACYGVGAAMGLILLAWIPQRRFCFTRAGADTMVAYLLHGPVVAVLRVYALPAAIYPVAAVGLVWLIDRLFRWNGCLYGIVSGERRGNFGLVWKGL